MTKEKTKVETIEINHLSGLHSIDLSRDYVCDVETGLCGPVEAEKMKNEETEEKQE